MKPLKEGLPCLLNQRSYPNTRPDRARDIALVVKRDCIIGTACNGANVDDDDVHGRLHNTWTFSRRYNPVDLESIDAGHVIVNR